MRLRDALNALKNKPYTSIAYLPNWYNMKTPKSAKHIRCNPDSLKFEVVYKDGFVGDLDSYLDSRQHIKPWSILDWEVTNA